MSAYQQVMLDEEERVKKEKEESAKRDREESLKERIQTWNQLPVSREVISLLTKEYTKLVNDSLEMSSNSELDDVTFRVFAIKAREIKRVIELIETGKY